MNTLDHKIIDIIQKILKNKVNLTTDKNNNHNWDSLKHIEIILAIEEEFNITFSENEATLLTSVASFIHKLSDET